ncbi:MAG: hypothetical protein AAFR27_15455, partial [Pseudomonadota bacterium]
MQLTQIVSLKIGLGLVAGSLMLWPAVGQAAQGKQVLDDWVAAADASPLFDLAYASASEDGSLLTIKDLELSVSVFAIVRFLSSKVGYDMGDLAEEQRGEFKYVITLAEASINGLTDEATFIAAEGFMADSLTLRTDFGGPGTSVQTYTDITVEDWKSAKWPTVSDAPEKPISKFLP